MLTPAKSKVLELFTEGRRHYKLLEFSQAKDFFEQALKIDPQDGPSAVYLERCIQFIDEPPPEDWDGVYVMKTK